MNYCSICNRNCSGELLPIGGFATARCCAECAARIAAALAAGLKSHGIDEDARAPPKKD